MQAGIKVGDFNTSNEVIVLSRTGAFERAVDITSSANLCMGDILVTRTKGHTVIVTKGFERDNTPPKAKHGKMSVEDVAREVIMGKWGVNPERKSKLLKAGYNPSDVQTEVNKLMK